MAGSTDLYELIGTLSKMEKRYCRLMLEAGTGRKARSCLRLFEILTAVDRLNESDVRAAVANETFAGHLAVTKNNLYEHLLRSLCSFGTAGGALARIRSLTEGAEILSDRGLHRQARERLRAARDLAERYGHLPEQLTLARLDWYLDSQSAYADSCRARLIERRDHVRSIVEGISNYWDHLHLFAMISYELVQRGPGGGEARQRVQEIVHGPLARMAPPSTTGARRYHMEAMRLYHMLTARYNDGYRHSVQHLAFVESQPMHERLELYNYITLLFTHVVLAVKTGRNAEAHRAYNTLCALEPRTRMRRVQQAQLAFCCRMELLLIDYQHEALAAMREELDELCSRDRNGFAAQLRMGYLTDLAYAQFVNGCLGDAIRTLHPLINGYRPGFRDDILCVARLLMLMIHYDAGNLELLPYLIRSTFRFIARCRGISAADRAVLGFMRRLPNICTQEELIAAFALAHDELAAIAVDPAQEQGSAIACILPWLQSRITGRPFGEVAREARRAMVMEEGDRIDASCEAEMAVHA
ncbi:MAG TPA: hypothetical protein VHI13_00765 [Candidatus Kapabacteria bacterium]|nr:hypothetical protein [Candidatus Kapabacteria bacterium]